jgi:hypothetical protein
MSTASSISSLWIRVFGSSKAKLRAESSASRPKEVPFLGTFFGQEKWWKNVGWKSTELGFFGEDGAKCACSSYLFDLFSGWILGLSVDFTGIIDGFSVWSHLVSWLINGWICKNAGLRVVLGAMWLGMVVSLDFLEICLVPKKLGKSFPA